MMLQEMVSTLANASLLGSQALESPCTPFY